MKIIFRLFLRFNFKITGCCLCGLLLASRLAGIVPPDCGCGTDPLADDFFATGTCLVLGLLEVSRFLCAEPPGCGRGSGGATESFFFLCIVCSLLGLLLVVLLGRSLSRGDGGNSGGTSGGWPL